MLNIIKKSMLTGIGLALIAKDEVEELAKELISKGKMSEKEGSKFIEDLQKKYDETQNRLEERVQQATKEFLKKAEVVTADELRGLKKEIRELKKAISGGTDSPK
jgi:polyhydroxyalkanoate synthesis regulator phasin